jgi:phosphoglycolate phosphatase
MTKNYPGFIPVLDWNGTVIDDTGAAHESLVSIQQYYGYAPCTIEQFRCYFEMPLPKLYVNAGFSQEHIDEHYVDMQAMFHRVYAPKEAVVGLRAGAMEMFGAFREAGVTSIILSNHLHEPIVTHCKRLGISPYVESYLANKDQDEQRQHIPKQERLRTYIKAKGLSSEQIIIIGDTPEESHISKEMGLKSIALLNGYATLDRLKAAEPNEIVESLAEVPAAVRRLLNHGGPS